MDKKELDAWGQRLDAGNTGDATLELAEQLSMHRSPSVDPSTGFKLSLKNQLLATSGEKTAQRASLFWRWAATLIVAVILAVGLFAGLNPIIEEPQPVSAAEILQRANQAYISQIQSGEVLHTKFNLAWGPFMSFNTFGEQWLHTDGELFRSQLANKDGILFYFAQSDGEIVWRSIHKGEIGNRPIYSVYALSPEQYIPFYMMPLETTPFFTTPEITVENNVAPLFGDISGWIGMDQWILMRSQDCEDLYCLLGLADSDQWECDGSRCTLPLAVTFLYFNAPGANLEVQVTGTEETEDGRIAYVMQFHTDRDGTLMRTLKFDTETFALLEILAHRYNQVSGKTEVSARMTYTLREFLPMTEELLQSFSIVPDSLEVIPYEENADLSIPDIPYSSFNHPGQSSILVLPVIHGVSPAAGKTLSGRVEFEMRISYNLGYAPEADLIIRLCETRPDQSEDLQGDILCTNELASTQVKIFKGENTNIITITVDVDKTWPDSVSLVIEIFVDEETFIQFASVYGPWIVEP